MRSRMLHFVMAAGLATVMTGGVALTGCSTEPKTAGERQALDYDVRGALSRAESTDPSLNNLLDSSYGYAIFPNVGKGGLGVGGAYGRGEVFQHGQMIGYSDLTQATIGLQAGAQKYTEILVFRDKAALDRFTGGNFRFDAAATAVALKAGVGANAPFTNGVSVITTNEAGLMAEAVIGGQKFSFEPAS